MTLEQARQQADARLAPFLDVIREKQASYFAGEDIEPTEENPEPAPTMMSLDRMAIR